MVYGTITIYKDYGIDFNDYGTGEYSIQYYGDDIEFRTIQEAKAFIDEITEAEK